MKNLIAYKSNALVEASYKLSLPEQRFLLVCIGRFNSLEENPEKTMTITAAEFYETFPVMGRANTEMEMNKAVDRLWDRSIILRDDEKREEFRWIQSRAQYIKGEAKVKITFSDAILPYLSKLGEQFTRVIVKNVSKLSSTYSIRIYELLQQFRITGERTIVVDDFRSMLGIEDKYKTFKSLNQLLLQPAIKELNEKSNITVTVTTLKQGRTVTSLKFEFKSKNKEDDLELGL